MFPFKIEDILKIVGNAVVPTVLATNKGDVGGSPNSEQKSLENND
jgi:hypothetical protein